MFYFECTYRSKSEWQRNIPAHPQSDSSHCTKFFISCFKPSKPNPPTQTRAALRANQNAGGFVFWRGVREICPVCFDQCCQTHATETIKPNTHTLTHFTTAGFQREELTGSDTILSQTALWEQTWPTVTHQHRNNPEDTVSINPQTWVKTQKSPLKHLHC